MLPPPFTGALILTGPTGSGKSQLALELAPRLDAEIISMDSMAVYRRLDIGTAKPTIEERKKVPHHLVDVLEPWESASVAWWLREAAACCSSITQRGKQVLIVGGTPLYLKALLYGLFDGPPANDELRRRLTQEGLDLGAPALHARLAHLDPSSAARLHPNDLRRIIRALEVLELTGRPLSAWQQQWPEKKEAAANQAAANQESGEVGEQAGSPAASAAVSGLPHDSCLLTPDSSILWLDLARAMLYDRINRRVEEMFAGGLVEEVRALARQERPLSREALQALGYKEVFAYLEGGLGLDETIAQVQTRSRNFAKRQITWFRHLPACRSATSELTAAIWRPKMKW